MRLGGFFRPVGFDGGNFSDSLLLSGDCRRMDLEGMRALVAMMVENKPV
jgi:hypothetical protein